MLMTLLTVALSVFFLHSLYEFWLRKPWISRVCDRHVLVTGCDSGFGKALAQRLDTLGCHVLAGCLTQQGVEELTETCSSRLSAFILDVSKEESVKNAFKLVTGQIPEGIGLHGLVNNAGILAGKRIPPLPDFHVREDLQEVFEVNLVGMADMMFTFLPLIKQAKGRIVNTSSMVGRLALGLNIPYDISKHGVQTLSDSTRTYLAKHGVKVCIIEPGAFHTNIMSTSNFVPKLLEGYRRLSQNNFHMLELITEAEYMQKVEKLQERYSKMSPNMGETNIMPVVDAYMHALFSVHPKKRYGVGKDARFLLIPLSYAPSCLQDFFLLLLRKLFQFPDPRKNA